MPTSRTFLARKQKSGPSGLRGLLLKFGHYGSLAFGLTAVALTWTATTQSLKIQYEQTEKAALHNARNLSRAFEEQIIRSIGSVDQTLLYVRETYARDPKSFDMTLWSRNTQFLSGIAFQVAIIDDAGIMVSSNAPGSWPGIDLSDREHFKVHVGDKPDTLFVSKPVLGRVSKKWSIQMTRRITMPDGGFGGVVVVSVDPEYLSAFYKSIDVGDFGSIALIGTDGVVRARSAKGSLGIGESVAGRPLLANFARSKEGAITTTSHFDGRERLFVYRAVSDHPLVIVVGLDKDEVFSIYQKNRRSDFAIAATLSFILLFATYLLMRYQRILAAARDAAEAGARARSKFLALMSHEIRTPMNGVIGTAELLIDSPLDPQQRVYATTLKESARHLLQVLNNVLDFSKLEANRVEPEKVVFNPHTVIRECIAGLSSNAAKKGLELTLVVDPDVPASVIGDPARLRQLLFNLVGNGLKFTKNGGVAVTVKRQRGTRQTQACLEYAIADTGMGIPEDALPLLFREFSQLDNTIARRFGGSGLGLAICKRLVDLMGGHIWVTSELGSGTTFSFAITYELPAPSTCPVVTSHRSPSIVPQLPGRQRDLRILLVEDIPTNQMVAIKFIESLGFNADIAENGVAAVEACRDAAYDIIFMDVMMPEMDGLMATRAIRNLAEPNNGAIIVALSASTDPQDRATCIDSGMDDFLGKPVTCNDIAAMLSRHFGTPSPDVAGTAIPAPLRESFRQDASRQPTPIFEPNTYGELEDVLGRDDAQALLGMFMADSDVRLAAMRQAAVALDRSLIKREAHAMTGSAASLGFLALSHQAKVLGAEALGLSAEDLQMSLTRLTNAFDDIRGKAADITRSAALPAPL